MIPGAPGITSKTNNLLSKKRKRCFFLMSGIVWNESKSVSFQRARNFSFLSLLRHIYILIGWYLALDWLINWSIGIRKFGQLYLESIYEKEAGNRYGSPNNHLNTISLRYYKNNQNHEFSFSFWWLNLVDICHYANHRQRKIKGERKTEGYLDSIHHVYFISYLQSELLIGLP